MKGLAVALQIQSKVEVEVTKTWEGIRMAQVAKRGELSNKDDYIQDSSSREKSYKLALSWSRTNQSTVYSYTSLAVKS